MNRFWSILFFLVPILGIGTFIMAAMNIWPLENCWLPANINQSGQAIDDLFNGIHILCAVILGGTGIAIGWAIWKFDHRRSDSKKAAYFHHNTKLEIVWTLIPAIILVALAMYQMKAWEDNKMNRPQMQLDGETVPVPPLAMVKAKQFGWEFHYAGADGKVETQDDIYVENLLVVPINTDVVLQMESRDVIHSFSVSSLRMKQDIIPGMTQFAWFHATQAGETEIACTELCGWGHYKMKAKMEFVSQANFDKWLAEQTSLYAPEIAADLPAEDDSTETAQAKKQP